MTFPLFSKNGTLAPIEQANISLLSIEYSYGFGVYETLRVQKHIPYFLAEHADRLLDSARIIGLEYVYCADDISRFVRELVAQLSEETYNLKILLIGGKTAQDAMLYIIPIAPLFPDRKLYRDGVSVITAHYERLFPHAKTLNMLGSYLAYRKAREAGCYDALLVDRDGMITEGTRSNLFGIRGKTVISPPADDILQGVTRTAVLRLLTTHGYDYKETHISPANIDAYDGAFLTNTSSGIMPIRRVDSFEYVSIAESLQQLMVHYDVWKKECKGELK